MKVKKEVEELIKEYREAIGNKKRFDDITEIFKKKYKMNAFEILALFYSPLVVEWDFDNRNLLFDEGERKE
jgi:hypothetical protein